jgi:hypothetical protein
MLLGWLHWSNRMVLIFMKFFGRISLREFFNATFKYFFFQVLGTTYFSPLLLFFECLVVQLLSGILPNASWYSLRNIVTFVVYLASLVKLGKTDFDLKLGQLLLYSQYSLSTCNETRCLVKWILFCIIRFFTGVMWRFNLFTLTKHSCTICFSMWLIQNVYYLFFLCLCVCYTSYDPVSYVAVNLSSFHQFKC